MTTTQTYQKSKTILVLPKHVGSIIGQKGQTIIGIAKSAGVGCRIQHQREKKGTFVISARDTATLLRAEIKLKEHVKSLETKHGKHSHYGNKHIVKEWGNSSGNRFESLQEKEEEEAIITPKTTQNSTPISSTLSPKTTDNSTPITASSLQFHIKGSIRDRKTEKWLKYHASTKEKSQFEARQHRKFKTDVDISPPSLLPEPDYKAPLLTGHWANIDKSDKADERRVEDEDDFGTFISKLDLDWNSKSKRKWGDED
jgi:hypothetical protein